MMLERGRSGHVPRLRGHVLSFWTATQGKNMPTQKWVMAPCGWPNRVGFIRLAEHSWAPALFQPLTV